MYLIQEHSWPFAWDESQANQKNHKLIKSPVELD